LKQEEQREQASGEGLHLPLGYPPGRHVRARGRAHSPGGL